MGLLGGLLGAGIRRAVTRSSPMGGGLLRGLTNQRGSTGGGSAPVMSQKPKDAEQQEGSQAHAEQPQPADQEPLDSPVVKNPATPHQMVEEAAQNIASYGKSPVAGLVSQPQQSVGSVPPPQDSGMVPNRILQDPPPVLPRLQVEYRDGNPSRAPKLATYGEAPVGFGYQNSGPGPVPATQFRYRG